MLRADGLIVYVGYILGLYRPVHSIARTLIPRLRVLGSLALGFLFAAWTTQKTTRILSKPLLVILLVFVVSSAYILFIVLELIPAWVLILIALFSAALSFVKHRYNPNQQRLPQILFDSVAISTAVSLVISNLVKAFF